MIKYHWSELNNMFADGIPIRIYTRIHHHTENEHIANCIFTFDTENTTFFKYPDGKWDIYSGEISGDVLIGFENVNILDIYGDKTAFCNFNRVCSACNLTGYKRSIGRFVCPCDFSLCIDNLDNCFCTCCIFKITEYASADRA